MITLFFKGRIGKISLQGIFLFLFFLLLFITSCSDTKTIITGGKSLLPGTCVKCHGDIPTEPVIGARTGYNTSGHKNLSNAYYSNGDTCQQCHTSEGFIESVHKDKAEQSSFIASPSEVSCFTCHSPHETGDMSIITEVAVLTPGGGVFDRGTGNLCARCHHALDSGNNLVKPMPANKVMSYWGAHHGPQADMITGTGAYHYNGKSYSNAMHSKVVQDSCTSCHMALPKGRYSLSPAIGGHSFNTEGEVHHMPKVNTAGCVSCHSEITQKVVSRDGKRKGVYAINAGDDYDQDSVVETVQEEVMGLLAIMVNKTGTGYLQSLALPFYDKTGNFIVPTSDVQRSVTEMAALFNYKFVLEDRSNGIHNAVYAIQILYDTIETLDTGFDISRRPE